MIISAFHWSSHDLLSVDLLSSITAALSYHITHYCWSANNLVWNMTFPLYCLVSVLVQSRVIKLDLMEWIFNFSPGFPYLPPYITSLTGRGCSPIKIQVIKGGDGNFHDPIALSYHIYSFGAPSSLIADLIPLLKSSFWDYPRGIQGSFRLGLPKLVELVSSGVPQG